MVSAAVDDLKVIVLLLIKKRVPTHHIGEAKDGVQGGAQFMAHVGEEHTLGAVGGLGRFLCPPQLKFEFLLFRNIKDDAVGVERFTGVLVLYLGKDR